MGSRRRRCGGGGAVGGLFGVGDHPLRRWSAGGASSRGRRPGRARRSLDLPCAASFSCCCGAAARELSRSSRAGRVLQLLPAAVSMAAEARRGSGARGAPARRVHRQEARRGAAGSHGDVSQGFECAQAVVRWLLTFVFVAGGAAALVAGSGSSSYCCSSFVFDLCTVYMDDR